MKKNFFTVVELITVIAIIAILAALLLPAIQAVRRQAKKTQARSEMNAIVTAIKSYESIFGILPAPTNWVNGNIDIKYADLMTLLTCVDAPGVEGGYQGGNLRKIRFLEVPTNYTVDNYLDPWGQEYIIYMDTDYDGEIGSVGPTGETLYGTAFIYSTGGQTVTPVPSDCIYSWK